MKIKCPYCGAYVLAERKACTNCKTALPVVKRPAVVPQKKEPTPEELHLEELKRQEEEEQRMIEQTKKVLRLIYIGAVVLFIVFFVIILATHVNFTNQFGY